MFKPGGSWKEFGIGRGETHTILPFWLFAIFWAFISYGVALVVLSQFANLALAPAAPPMQMYNQPHISQQQPMMQQAPMLQQAPMMQQQPMMQQAPVIQQRPMPPSNPNFLKPVSSIIGLQRNEPGYYVLANSTSGSPQYIYYGTSPPAAGPPRY